MIREMCPDDFALYRAMSLEFYATDAVDHPLPEAYFQSVFQEILHKGPYMDGYILCTCDGTPAGYAVLSKMWAVEAGGLCVWIEDLYIREPYRGQHLGSAFFDFLREKYPEARRFRLEVEADNLPAVALYKKYGFGFLPYQQMIRDRKGE